MTAARSTTGPDPRRGEIWWVVLGPTKGSEIRKTRPCVVIGTDALRQLPMRIVVPLTTWRPKHKKRPWCAVVDADGRNGLHRTSAADAVQIRAVAVERFQRGLGVADARTLSQVLAAVALCLDLSL